MTRWRAANGAICITIGVMVLSLTTLGCGRAIVRSQRFENGNPFDPTSGAESAAALPASEPCDCEPSCGPFGCGGPWWTFQRARAVTQKPPTVRPPNPRYHPLPTRPVFEPREEYQPLVLLNSSVGVASSVVEGPMTLPSNTTPSTPVGTGLPATEQSPATARLTTPKSRVEENLLRTQTSPEPVLNRPQQASGPRDSTAGSAAPSTSPTIGSARLISATVQELPGEL